MEKEWENEPDHDIWLEDGFICEVLRNKSLGSLNGYIYMTKNHPYFGTDYLKVDIDCHGGLTYSGFKSELYCVGFDCSHAWDLCPGYLAMGAGVMEESVYRNFEYVTNEVKNMVIQLKKHAPSFATEADVAKLLLAYNGMGE